MEHRRGRHNHTVRGSFRPVHFRQSEYQYCNFGRGATRTGQSHRARRWQRVNQRQWCHSRETWRHWQNREKVKNSFFCVLYWAKWVVRGEIGVEPTVITFSRDMETLGQLAFLVRLHSSSRMTIFTHCPEPQIQAEIFCKSRKRPWNYFWL